MPSDHEKAIAWLRDQVVRTDIPPTIRDDLKRQLQAYRQNADDVFEGEPEEAACDDPMLLQPLRC
jgi:hypothetical protein